MANRTVKIFENDDLNLIGMEERDDKDRMIRLSAYPDKDSEERGEFEYDEKDHVCKEVRTDLEKGRIKHRTTEYYTYIHNDKFQVYNRITIEEFDNKGHRTSIDDIEFDIDAEELPTGSLSVICSPKNTGDARYTTYLFDLESGDLIMHCNKVFNTECEIRSYIDKEDGHTIQVNTIKCKDDGYERSDVHTYDNGLYEKTCNYDKNNKLTDILIRGYSLNKLCLYEYYFDNKGELTEVRYYAYENGRLMGVYNENGDAILHYLYNDGLVETEYPIRLDSCIDYVDTGLKS